MINAVLQVNLDFSIIVTMFFTLIISLTFFLILRKMIIKNSNKTHPIYESKLNDFQNKFDTFLSKLPELPFIITSSTVPTILFISSIPSNDFFDNISFINLMYKEIG